MKKFLTNLLNRKSGNGFTRLADLGTFGINGIRYPGLSEGDAFGNTVVMAALRWSLDACLEPELRVWEDDGDSWNPIAKHPLTEMLRSPLSAVSVESSVSGQTYTQKVSGKGLRRWIRFCTMMDGNCYLHKLRAASGRVVGLDPLPYGSCEPVAKSGTVNVLDYYRVKAGTVQQIHPDDIVHIREGVPDYQNPLASVSPLKSAMRHILTDNQIAVYTYAVLQHPAPGMVLSVQHDEFNQTMAQELTRQLKEAATGEKHGSTLVLSGDVSLNTVGYSPDQMALEKMPTLPEERICAVLGIPPILLGIGAGLDASTYSNYEQALKAAVMFNLIPHWDTVGDDLTVQLLPDFDSNPSRKLDFDTRNVQALQEDENARHDRVRADFQANLIPRDKALDQLGMVAGPEDVGVYAYQLRPAPGAMSPESMPQGVSAARSARLAAERGL